jgi:hypothetical protein
MESKVKRGKIVCTVTKSPEWSNGIGLDQPGGGGGDRRGGFEETRWDRCVPTSCFAIFYFSPGRSQSQIQARAIFDFISFPSLLFQSLFAVIVACVA